MLQDSWENGDKAFVPRVRATRNSDAYAMLPQEFKNADVQQRLNITQVQANSQIQRWLNAGYIERVKQGVFKKVLDFII
jgi:Fic family protein